MIKPRGIIYAFLIKPRVKWFKAGCKACINKPHEKSLLRHHDAAGPGAQTLHHLLELLLRH